MVKAALGNPNLTEAQVLRVLWRDKLPAVVVQSIGTMRSGATFTTCDRAIRQPATTLTTILAYLPELTVSDLNQMVAPGILPENLRHYLQAEIQRRLHRPKAKDAGPSLETAGALGKEDAAAPDGVREAGSDPEEAE